MIKNKSIGIMLPIEFKRGKDKKKRKKRSNRREAIIAAASIGGGARIGGIHGFIRGRGGLGGPLERMYRVDVINKFDKKARKAAKPIIDEGFSTARAGDNLVRKNRKNMSPSDLSQITDIKKGLNQRGRKMAIKHAAIGAGIGATAYGGYRAIKTLRNRKKNKK